MRVSGAVFMYAYSYIQMMCRVCGYMCVSEVQVLLLTMMLRIKDVKLNSRKVAKIRKLEVAIDFVTTRTGTAPACVWWWQG